MSHYNNTADRVFGGGGAPPITVQQAIQIGGVPLNECLASMMDLIRLQQRTIDDLQNRDRENLDRIGQLERYVSVISRDLRLDARPISCYGQPDMPTISDSLTNVEYRVTRLIQQRHYYIRKQCALILRNGDLRTAFQRWQSYATLRSLFHGSSRSLLSRYSHKWRRYIEWSKVNRARQRHQRALRYMSTKVLVNRYYDTWRRYVVFMDQQHNDRRLILGGRAETVAQATMRGLARRFFVRWVDFIAECRLMQHRVHAVGTLEQRGSRLLARKYLAKWLTFRGLMTALRIRNGNVNLHASKAHKRLASIYLDKWRAFAQRCSFNRQARSAVPRLHHLRLVALARRYFQKLQAFARFHREQREKMAMQLAIQQLARRCDSLGSQLDIGLQTLSHTNSVLSKVLEHVSFNPAISPSRHEDPHQADPRANSAAATLRDLSPMSPPKSAPRGGWGVYDPEWNDRDDAATRPMSAEELLVQLRSRLAKAMEQ